MTGRSPNSSGGKSAEGATLPDGTKYTSEAELEPTPAETAHDDTGEPPRTTDYGQPGSSLI
jgi:hypothetical protein